MNSLEIRQQRADLINQSKQWLDKAAADGLSDTEIDAEWAKRNADIDRMEAEAKTAERAERMNHLTAGLTESTGRKTVPTQPGTTRSKSLDKTARNKNLKAWLGYGRGLALGYDGDTIARCAESGLNLADGTVSLRAMNTGTATAGGNATFQSYLPDLQTEMKYFSPLVAKANVLNTADGNNFTLPRGSDVNNLMSIVAQSGSVGTSTDPTFDKVQVGAYTFRYVELVTYEMLQDAVFDVEGWITSRLAERAARTLEYYALQGTGSSQPTGLVTACKTADGNTPAVTLAATNNKFYRFEDLFSLFAATDRAYRQDNTLILHDSSVWDLRRIKDSAGRYIWDVNNTLVQAAQPDKIAGYNYLVSNSIDASGAFSKNLAVFANLPRYVVRLVNDVQITRLNERYRDVGAIGFEVLMRFDANYIGHASSIARVATPAS